MSAPFVIPGVRPLQRRSDNSYMAQLEADVMPTLTALKLATERTSYIGRKGDLTCWLTDIDYAARKREPAMLLASTVNPTERHVYVPLSQLWLLLDPVFYDASGKVDRRQTEDAQRKQQAALLQMTERLFGFVTKQDHFRVLDALFDFAEDLKNAKPPQGYTLGQWLQALAEDDMVITHNGQAMNG